MTRNQMEKEIKKMSIEEIIKAQEKAVKLLFDKGLSRNMFKQTKEWNDLLEERLNGFEL